LLSQPAYEICEQEYGDCMRLEEMDLPFKHEGKVLAYGVTFADGVHETADPPWLRSAE